MIYKKIYIFFYSWCLKIAHLSTLRSARCTQIYLKKY